ncbi:hypothetical protein DFQ26_007526 [Actinomortierella ambigua]|nr:hypothetical protein DFQ26_007526 [Actinomortierella ambigua]
MRHVPLNAFESKLKRQLTGGRVAADQQRQEGALPDKYQEHKMMMAAMRREQQEREEEEEDSRTRTISKGASSGPTTVATSTSSTPAKTKSTPPKSESPTVADGSSKAPALKQHGNRKMPAVHPALLKGNPPAGSHNASHPSTSANHQSASSTAGASIGGGGSGKNKRTGDFFSMYMNERAEKMAKKQKRAQAKRDDSDDD